MVRTLSVFTLSAIAMMSGVAHGQAAGGGGIPGGAAPPAGNIRVVGGMGGAPTREKMLATIQEQLGVDDAEWETLTPLVENVLNAKHRLNTGAGVSWQTKNGQAPQVSISPSAVDTPAGKALQEVRVAIADKAVPEEIAAKLAALKEVRAQARADFAEAVKTLTEALTPIQQAILTTMGTIE